MLQTLTALAEPTRLRIVEVLGRGPRSVGEICDRLAIEQPQASKHLRVLRESGLVVVETRAQLRVYSLRARPLRELNAWLQRYRSIWAERLDRLDELVVDLTREKERNHGRKTRK